MLCGPIGLLCSSLVVLADFGERINAGMARHVRSHTSYRFVGDTCGARYCEQLTWRGRNETRSEFIDVHLPKR